MAFIVETGNGAKVANSYTTVAKFQEYFADRNIDVTAMTTEQIQAYLVAATDYIDTRWGPKFKGSRKYDTSLYSRVLSVFTDNPTAADTLIVDGTAYTFVAATTGAANEILIGDTVWDTINNVIVSLDEDTIKGYLIADADISSLTIFFIRDGIIVTESSTNISIDASPSYGLSNKRQPLEFPRENLRDRSGELVTNVPDKLQYATIEYGYRASKAVLAPDPTVSETGLRVTKTRDKVGPVETEIEYADATSIMITKPYPAADRLLAEYTFPAGVTR
ncbi:MAG: hypothetical protein KAR40_06065 [Candidatus Sabulitectum sp.]|nr:hypothetical protein [Candidatus Sabulitectum sp.]